MNASLSLFQGLLLASAVLLCMASPALLCGQEVDTAPEEVDVELDADLTLDEGLDPDAEMIDEAEEPLLPVLPPISRYEEIWKNSPFELEAAPDVAATSKTSFARDYALNGLLKQGDETVVYLINRKTRETVRVTSEGAGSDGFKLRSIEGGSNNVREVEAMIEKDGEVARISYDRSLIPPASPGGLAGSTNAREEMQRLQQAGAGGVAAAATRAREVADSAKSRPVDNDKANYDAATGAKPGATRTDSSRRRLMLPQPMTPAQ